MFMLSSVPINNKKSNPCVKCQFNQVSFSLCSVFWSKLDFKQLKVFLLFLRSSLFFKHNISDCYFEQGGCKVNDLIRFKLIFQVPLSFWLFYGPQKLYNSVSEKSKLTTKNVFQWFRCCAGVTVMTNISV